MTGPEHFKKAERLLQKASGVAADDPAEQYCLAAAQVHATLALAATHAEQYAKGYDGDIDTIPAAWSKALR